VVILANTNVSVSNEY